MDEKTITEKQEETTETGVQTTCPKCHGKMICNPRGACWCLSTKVEGLLPIEGSLGCLCPSCLKEKVQNGQSNFVR